MKKNSMFTNRKGMQVSMCTQNTVLKIPGKYIQRCQQNIIFSVVSYSSLTMIYYYYSSKIKGILCPPPPICNLTWC